MKSVNLPNISNIFEDQSIETLHVPVGTKSSYSGHMRFWNSFQNIVEDADL